MFTPPQPAQELAKLFFVLQFLLQCIFVIYSVEYGEKGLLMIRKFPDHLYLFKCEKDVELCDRSFMG